MSSVPTISGASRIVYGFSMVLRSLRKGEGIFDQPFECEANYVSTPRPGVLTVSIVSRTLHVLYMLAFLRPWTFERWWARHGSWTRRCRLRQPQVRVLSRGLKIWTCSCISHEYSFLHILKFPKTGIAVAMRGILREFFIFQSLFCMEFLWDMHVSVSAQDMIKFVPVRMISKFFAC